MKEKELKQMIKDKEKLLEKQEEELCELKYKYRTEFEEQALKEKYLNKYYVYYNNCYSCAENPEDYWNDYFKVIDVKDNEIVLIKFYKDSDGDIGFEKETHTEGMIKSLTEILQEEYLKQFDLLINDVMKLRI